MISIKFAPTKEGSLKLLLLGAHCDDIEIGCGGTLLKLIRGYENIQVCWVVFTSNEVRKKEAQSSADKFLEGVDDKQVKILHFKDGFLPSVWSDVKIEFEKLKEFSPDVIFTHYRNDLHQDHRTLNELTWNTFRNHLICEYEIPKYDGDLGNPNLFVPIEKRLLKQKNDIIMNCFKSQSKKHWLDRSLLTSISRIRGVECGSITSYAEAFYSRKMTL